MYLILPSDQAEARNRSEATKRGCTGKTIYWWVVYTNGDKSAIDVIDGNGLTDSEISSCIDKLPEEFIVNP